MTPEVLVQSRPADQFYSTLLQVKVAGQDGFDVAFVRIMFHRLIQLYDTAEFVAVAILRVGKNELCVVLCRHG